MVTILELPDDCTLLVLDHFSLNEMIHLRRVCPTWNDLITKICSMKQRLYIFFDQTVVANYIDKNILGHKHECLKITRQNTLIISKQIIYFVPGILGLNHNEADGSFCELTNNPKIGFRFVTRLFPNVSKLTYEPRQNLMNEMHYLLWKWSTKLETLVLFTSTHLEQFAESFRVFEDISADFWQCFGQMRSLRQFHIINSNLKFFVSLNNDSHYYNATIETMGKLEEFTLDLNLSINCCEFASYYAQLNNCKHLRVGKYIWKNSSNLNELNSELTCNLTHLSVHFKDLYDKKYFKSRIEHPHAQLISLSYLEILDTYCGSLLPDLLQYVMLLKNLKTLVLKIDLFEMYFEKDGNSSGDEDNIPAYRATFPIFRNIIELHIIDNSASLGRDFQNFKLLARIFAKLEKICIFTNQIEKTTFDAEIRPKLIGAFGEQIKIELSL